MIPKHRMQEKEAIINSLISWYGIVIVN